MNKHKNKTALLLSILQSVQEDVQLIGPILGHSFTAKYGGNLLYNNLSQITNLVYVKYTINSATYVGITVSKDGLVGRLWSHHKLKNKYSGIYYLLLCKNKKDVRKIERLMIKQLNPKLNKNRYTKYFNGKRVFCGNTKISSNLMFVKFIFIDNLKWNA